MGWEGTLGSPVMPAVLQERVNVVVLCLTAEKMDTPGGLKGEIRPPLCVPYFFSSFYDALVHELRSSHRLPHKRFTSVRVKSNIPSLVVHWSRCRDSACPC